MGSQMLVAAYAGDGTQLWYQTHGDAGLDETAHRFVRRPDGTFELMGTSKEDSEWANIFFANLNADGELIGTELLVNANRHEAVALTLAPDGSSLALVRSSENLKGLTLLGGEGSFLLSRCPL